MRRKWLIADVAAAILVTMGLLAFMFVMIFRRKEGLDKVARDEIKNMCSSITLKWGGTDTGSVNKHVKTVGDKYSLSEGDRNKLRNMCLDAAPKTDGKTGTTKLESKHQNELKRVCKDNFLDTNALYKGLQSFYDKYPGIDRAASDKACNKYREQAKAESKGRMDKGGLGTVECKSKNNNKGPGEMCTNQSLRQTRPCLSKNGLQCCEANGTKCQWISGQSRDQGVFVDATLNRGAKVGGSAEMCPGEPAADCLGDCGYVAMNEKRGGGSDCPSDYPVKIGNKGQAGGWDCTTSQACKQKMINLVKKKAAAVPVPANA